jgi:U3 small nucleolar RNA-associated protein 3
MGKKRKARGNPIGQLGEDQARPDVQTKYDADEEFANSEDEFFAGRDKILLEEGPATKRRKKVDEEGTFARVRRSLILHMLMRSSRTISAILR